MIRIIKEAESCSLSAGNTHTLSRTQLCSPSAVWTAPGINEHKTQKHKSSSSSVLHPLLSLGWKWPNRVRNTTCAFRFLHLLTHICQNEAQHNKELKVDSAENTKITNSSSWVSFEPCSGLQGLIRLMKTTIIYIISAARSTQMLYLSKSTNITVQVHNYYLIIWQCCCLFKHFSYENTFHGPSVSSIRIFLVIWIISVTKQLVGQNNHRECLIQ